jgi:hypothetical protein
MTPHRALAALPLLFVIALGRPASAQVPRHESVQISPIKQNGGVVGMKVKLILHTTDSVRFPKAHVGLVRPSDIQTLDRGQAVDPSQGKLIHQFEAVSGVLSNAPVEKEFQLMYGAGTSLKSGERFDMVSAWPVEGTKYEPGNVHVFGAVTFKKDGRGEFVAP